MLVSGQTERRTSGNVCQASSITYCCSTLLTVVLFIGFENAVGRGRGRCSMCWRALVGGLCVRICLLSDGAAAGGDVLVPSCHLDIHWVFTRFSRSESYEQHNCK